MSRRIALKALLSLGLLANPVLADDQADEAPLTKTKTTITFYGFVQLLGMHDTTQGFNEQLQAGAIQRPGTYGGEHGSSQLSARHSRFGLKLGQPIQHDIKATGQFEMDFIGNQPANPPGITESAFYQNATLRFRHVFAKLETPYVDVLAGQWWSLFGWQSYFHPNSVDIQGLPYQAFKRTAQIRVSKTLKSDAIDVDLAVAAQRPPARQSSLPDGEAGIKVSFNRLKAWRTRGANDSGLDAAALGVSVLGRRFAASEFAATPTKEVKRNGHATSLDAMVPIIPATKFSHSNALTVTASYVTGSGFADQYDGLTFGTANPNLPNPMMTNPAPVYTPNIDPGLALFSLDAAGNFNLHAIRLTSYMVGLQYYLPPRGRVWLAGNYTHVESGNAQFFGNPARIWDKGDYVDFNVFTDITPGFRVGALFSRNQQSFVEADAQGRHDAHNHRGTITALYLF